MLEYTFYFEGKKENEEITQITEARKKIGNFLFEMDGKRLKMKEVVWKLTILLLTNKTLLWKFTECFTVRNSS